MARPTRLVLLGHPVAHSLSPTFQNAALRRAGLPLTYEALDVPPAAFADTLRRLVAEGAAGNVTIPHKAAAFAACDRLTPIAERTGAVNAFRRDDDGALLGDNTDVGGFQAAATALLGGVPASLRVALIGAGGGAAAVLGAAERWPGAEVRVWSRTEARALALAGRFAPIARATRSVEEAVADADVVVNATPIGLSDDRVPVDVEALPRHSAVLDLVYRRGETAWVRQARARGMRAADGLSMLVEQGALAFRFWLGLEPDREAMREALRSR